MYAVEGLNRRHKRVKQMSITVTHMINPQAPK